MAFRCKGPQRLAMVLLGALAALIAVALFVPVMQQVRSLQQESEQLVQENSVLKGQLAAAGGGSGITAGGGRVARSAAAAQCPPVRECPPCEEASEEGAALSRMEIDAGSDGQVAVEAPDAAGTGFTLPPIDLMQLLGPQPTLDGLIYDPRSCFGPWGKVVADDTLRQQLLDMLQAALLELIGRVGGMDPSQRLAEAVRDNPQLDSSVINAPVMLLLGVGLETDPKFLELRQEVTKLMSTFALHENGSRFCICGRRAPAGLAVESVDDVGTPGCRPGRNETEPKDGGVGCLGSFPGWLLGGGANVNGFIAQINDEGVCTTRYKNINWATWWEKARLFNESYQNFGGATHAQDVVMELFDILYEHHHVFLRQKWLGYTMMQDPFDMLAIQMILFELKPDLIIETGTANGGSALLWASLLDIMGLKSTKIHTVDLNHPSSGFGSEDPTKTPTTHPFWKKYITFHQGYSTEPEILDKIGQAAAGAHTVLVLLDSDHSQNNVAAELDAYCSRFVTNNSYCIVEDTKLSRMTIKGGPLEAIWAFLGTRQGQDFEVDQGRELFYSQHVLGYLRRTKPFLEVAQQAPPPAQLSPPAGSSPSASAGSSPSAVGQQKLVVKPAAAAKAAGPTS